MKIATKIIAVIVAIVGLLAAVTGTRVLLGLFDPGYQYFTPLITYNIVAGIISIVAGWFIWKRKHTALFFSLLITTAHIIVLILLRTIYSDIISQHSVNAMTFRSVLWIIVTVIMLKSNSTSKE